MAQVYKEENFVKRNTRKLGIKFTGQEFNSNMEDLHKSVRVNPFAEQKRRRTGSDADSSFESANSFYSSDDDHSHTSKKKKKLGGVKKKHITGRPTEPVISANKLLGLAQGLKRAPTLV